VLPMIGTLAGVSSKAFAPRLSLAGGLGPDNVADAILAVRPAGVDSKTRTDVGDSHTKDLAKVVAFNKAAKTVALT
jgi:phosphoribosylanthranilate isomerase